MAVDTTRVFEVKIKIIDETKVPLENINKATNQLTSSFSNFSKAIIVANQGLEFFSRTIRMVSSAFDFLFKNSIALEQGIARISTLFDSTAESSRELYDSLIYLQRAYGTDQTDLIDAYYESIASGAVEAETATYFLNDAVKLAVGGMTTLETAIYGLTGMLSAYGMSVLEAKAVSDAMFIGAAQGKTNVTELAKSLGSASAMARQTGVSFQEYIAAVSAITSGGVPTREAVTQLESAMTSLARQTTELELLLYKLGITSIKAEVQANGLVPTLHKILQATDMTSETMMDLFGRIEGVNGIIALTSGTIGPKYWRMMDTIKEKSKDMGKVTDTAFKKMSDTVAYRLNQMSARLRTAFSREDVQQILTPILNGLDRILDVIDKLGKFNWVKLSGDIITFSLSLMAVGKAFKFLSFWASMGAFASLADFAAGIKLLAGSMGAFALASVKFTAVAAAWVAMAAAIDIIIRNITNLPNLFGSISDALHLFTIEMQIAFTSIGNWLFEMYIKILKIIKDISADIIDKMPGARKLFGKREAFDETPFEETRKLYADQLAMLEKSSEEISKKLEESSKKVDWGLSGDIIKFFSIELDKLTAKFKTPIATAKPPEEIIGERKFEIPPIFKPEDLELIKAGLGKTVWAGAAQFSNVMSFGVNGFMGAAALIVEAVDKILDLIPNFLNKVAGIFTKITDFPKVLNDAVKNLGKQVLYFIENFLPNALAQAIDAIHFADQFVLKLEESIYKLIDKLPQMFANAAKLIFNFITVGFKSLAVIFATPKILGEIGKAIIKGAVNSIPLIGAAITEEFRYTINYILSLFGQKGMFDIDTDKIGGELAKIAEDVSKSASDIFSVVDLEAQGRGMDTASRIKQSIDKASKTIGDIFAHWLRELQKFYLKLREIWLWVFNKFNEVLAFFRVLWEQVWDKATEFIFELISFVSNFIKELEIAVTNIWRLFYEAIAKIVDEINKVFAIIINNLSAVFNKFIELINATFNFIVSALVNFSTAIADIFNNLGNNLKTFVSGSLEFAKNLGSIITNGFTNALSSIGNYFSVQFSKDIANAFASVGRIFGDNFSSVIKIPSFDDSFANVKNFMNGFSFDNAFSGIKTFLSGFKFPTIEKPSWWPAATGGLVVPSTSSVLTNVSNQFARSDAGKVFGSISSGVSSGVKSVSRYFNDGGHVTMGNYSNGILYAQGGSMAMGTDTVPAMLTPGEFVVNREAASKNLGLLSFMNKVKSPLSPITATSSINVVINTTSSLTPEQIKREVVPTLERELKRKSQDGKFVLATTGLR